LATCVIIGYSLTNIFPLSAGLIIFGAFAATATEILPTPVDDNFSVAIVTGTVMFFAKKFF
jgi:dolichol kinase